MNPLLLAAIVGSSSAAGNPCAPINTAPDTAYEQAIAPAVANSLGVESVSIIKVFRYQGWSIVYAEPAAADAAFAFYSGPPGSGKAITVWGGAAAYFEEQAINDWTLQNAQGIPKQLAACFSWYVTHGRSP